MDERMIRESIRTRLASGQLRLDDGTLVVGLQRPTLCSMRTPN
jgi:hypothetical protein